LDESKAGKLTLEPILGCFHGLDESRRRSTYPGLFLQLDERKRAEKMLELAIPEPFLGLDESKADRPTLETILGCFHGLDESQRHSTYPELFSQPDERKRAEKTLELAIHRDKSKTVANTLKLVLSRTIQTRARGARPILD
jgi:predicted transcriptional regulator